MLTIYCKHEQLKGQWQEIGPLKSQVLALADKTIRVEIKLYRAGLLARRLGSLRAWGGLDVDAVFFQLLDKYRLTGTVQKQVLLSWVEQTLSKPQLRVYTAWLAGKGLVSLYSKATVYAHRKGILEAIGVDISLRYCPEADGMIDLANVFTPENIMGLPHGRLREDRYFLPREGS
ncbi:hypothetical protein PIGHUM_03467 [Pigmentiphaga humi]|uniref:Uncharacterized protein n=1 Tax=Pigmentiphaga humi TaxID=2478468 RepID=A0A3P4B522_9BURK|nr:hypothetical protein [Pigmentiphaga humi]VCU71383.1 hypothetical protein PIGHUM_03467 [Pigmentiphaga humi]